MTTATPEPNAAPSLTCGIVMPISPIDGCGADHWSDVKAIIQDAVHSIEPKFAAALVSDADDIGVIQKRIVQGIYSSDVIVCDVSAKNANVMFELGMRLAFDKPTVIIKDDKTDYSFDTGVIEHLTYPRDLRFGRMVAFKKQLADKVLATYQAAQRDPHHSTFLKNFGTFKVAHLNQKEASGQQVMYEMLSELSRQVSLVRSDVNRLRHTDEVRPDVSDLVRALVGLKETEPNFRLRYSEDLVDKLSLHPKFGTLASGYRSREAFAEALNRAVGIMLMKSRTGE